MEIIGSCLYLVLSLAHWFDCNSCIVVQLISMYGTNVSEPTRLKRTTRADLEQEVRFEKGTANGTQNSASGPKKHIRYWFPEQTSNPRRPMRYQRAWPVGHQTSIRCWLLLLIIFVGFYYWLLLLVRVRVYDGWFWSSIIIVGYIVGYYCW